jgi:ABC-2 type transport system permease protein/lipopolysaccharide transport system permease protein
VHGDQTVPQWRQNAAGRGGRPASLKALWKARDLVRFLALRDLQVRYKQAVLGVIWVLLQPIASVVIFTVVFSRLAGISSDGVPYPLFALVGMLVWNYFSSAIVRGSEVLVNNPSLVTKVYFPRIAAPAAALLPPLVDLAVSMSLLIPLLVYYQISLTWKILATPLWLALLMVAALGFATWLSALNVRFRDVRQAVTPIIQIWLLASPVAYPVSLVSGWRELMLGLNPMTGVIGLARWSLLDAPWPGWPLVVSLVMIVGVLGTGLMYFNRAERYFADVI